MKNNNQLTIVGVPSSAGAYSPGQEKTPNALRDIGLISFFRSSRRKAHDDFKKRQDTMGSRI